MNKAFYLIICMSLCIGCSEGDVIENDILFDAALQNCANQNDNTFVFYKVDTAINQAFSLSFTNTTFELNTVPEDLSFTIALNATTNVLLYRKFDTAINGDDYFCSSVPPGNINVTQELISSNGNVEILYAEKSNSGTTITYTRTVMLSNVTLEGDDIAIRQELLELGSDEFTITVTP